MIRKREPRFQINDKVRIKGEARVGTIIDINWVGMSEVINIELKPNEHDIYFYKVGIDDVTKDVVEADIIAKVE
ncbi:MAG: hypothetical protein MUP81_02400 [Dehalococcoidia bacterium]|nr:hypothetical protein [Dehalococcoidia bacterium]